MFLDKTLWLIEIKNLDFGIKLFELDSILRPGPRAFHTGTKHSHTCLLTYHFEIHTHTSGASLYPFATNAPNPLPQEG